MIGVLMPNGVQHDIDMAKLLVSHLGIRSFELNQGNMSSMCKKLESDGFIVKTRSQDDERCTYLSLTPKGEETIAAINSVLSYKDDECCLTKEEMKEAENAIAVIRRTLGIINEKFAEEFEKDKEKDA